MSDQPLCGILNLLKPPGMTSAGAVGFAKRALNESKIGHAGTLDPEAAGVLPLMVGKATRLFDYLQDKEKTYITEVAFTGATDTEDAQGRLIQPGNGCPTRQELEALLPRFIGEIQQRPPAFSALKQDGQRMYDLARQGKAPQLPRRPVTVYSLEIMKMTPNGALLKLRCSKGFYVRSLCRDLGESCHHPAHMRFLLRAQSGPFTLDNACTLEELSREGRKLLLPSETALPWLPMAEIPTGLWKPIRNGISVAWNDFPSLENTPAALDQPFGLKRMGEFCAIARRSGDQVRIQTWLNAYPEEKP